MTAYIKGAKGRPRLLGKSINNTRIVRINCYCNLELREQFRAIAKSQSRTMAEHMEYLMRAHVLEKVAKD